MTLTNVEHKVLWWHTGDLWCN